MKPSITCLRPLAVALCGAAALSAESKDWPISSVSELTTALTQAADNDTLTLAAKTYDLSGVTMDATGASHLLVEKNVTICCSDNASWRSSNNRTKAVFKGDKSARILHAKSAATIRDVSFVDGRSSASGAGVWVDVANSAVVVNLTNCIFEACVNTGDNGGGLSTPYMASAVMRDCLFLNNMALKNGAGAYKGLCYGCVFTDNAVTNEGGGALANGNMYDCVASGNTAKWGGAGSNVTAYRSTFLTNSASIVGGAMSNSHAYDCTFEGNVSKGGKGGGALYGDDSSTCQVRGSTFVGNRASGGNGGAVSGVLAVSNCTFYGNLAILGGAAYNVRSTTAVQAIQPVAIMDSYFWTNAVSSTGGAAYECDAQKCHFEGNEAVFGGAVSYATLTQCTLTGNVATNYGGAAYDVETCRKCTFTGNRAMTCDGGAIYQKSADSATLDDCDFLGNRITGNWRKGGAICCADAAAQMLVTNCTFAGNAAEGNCSAGAVYRTMNVVDSVFHDNTNGYYSGHAWYSGFRNCTFYGIGEVAMSRLVNCEFRDYRALNASFSAPIFANERDSNQSSFPALAVTNCLIRNCVCDSLVRVTGDQAFISNCTFADNTCNLACYLACGNKSKEPFVDVMNTVFGGNRASAESAANFKANWKFTPTTCCLTLRHLLTEKYDLPSTFEASKSSGLFTGPVRFCGADNVWGEPAYEPVPGRLWINRGLVWAGADNATDLAGRPRIHESGIDLGCYESLIDPPGLMLLVQ